MKIKIKSKTIKGRFIYGDLSRHKKADSLAVFLSGLSGSKEFPFLKEASKFFSKNGFSALRLNFCNDSDDKKQKASAIKLEEMKLSVYTKELKNVLDTFSKKYSRLVLVGHSFGAVIFVSFLSKYKTYIKRSELVLWEPSLLPWKRKWMKEDFQFDKNKNLYRDKHSKELMNKTFYNELITTRNTAEIFKSLKKDVIIIAGTKMGKINAREYFSKIRNKKASKLFFVNGASHSFEKKNHRIELFEETLKFLKS